MHTYSCIGFCPCFEHLGRHHRDEPILEVVSIIREIHNVTSNMLNICSNIPTTFKIHFAYINDEPFTRVHL